MSLSISCAKKKMRSTSWILLSCASATAAASNATAAAGVSTAGVSTAGVSARLGSWNLYYKALDDPLGRAAILATLDAVGSGGSGGGLFDFLATVEAAGDTSAGSFPAWAAGSKALGALTPLSTKSGYEALGLWCAECAARAAGQPAPPHVP